MEQNVCGMVGLSEPERWKPKEGESYWWLAVEKVVQEWTGNWRNHRDDRRRWELGNCFKTKGEAEQVRGRIEGVLLNFHHEQNSNHHGICLP